MKSIILAGAAALAFTTAPASAQDTDAEVTVYELGEDQMVIYDGWPEERRVVYDAWPYGVQEYYWTLEPAQTEGWWLLTDPQRVRIYEMTPEQRTMAWQQMNAQMSNNTSAPSTTGMSARSTSSATGTMSAQPRFVRSEVSQTTPANYRAASSGDDLPVCSASQQDGCMNSWEKNKTGNRPLEYWPGRPASQIDEPLPATRPADMDDDDD